MRYFQHPLRGGDPSSQIIPTSCMSRGGLARRAPPHAVEWRFDAKSCFQGQTHCASRGRYRLAISGTFHGTDGLKILCIFGCQAGLRIPWTSLFPPSSTCPAFTSLSRALAEQTVRRHTKTRNGQMAKSPCHGQSKTIRRNLRRSRRTQTLACSLDRHVARLSSPAAPALTLGRGES